MSSSLDQLKVEWTVKSLKQQCAEMTTGMNEKPVKELCVIFPWFVERVVGSLDGIIVGWSLSSLHAHSSDYNTALEFLQPSGPMMELVYKLQVEDYKFEIPITSLPDPVKVSMQDGLADCQIFYSKLQSQNQRLSLNAFEYYLFYFAASLITQNHSSGQHNNISDSVYFALVDAYLNYFLPTEGSSPSDIKGTIFSSVPRSSCVPAAGYSKTSKGLLKHQCSISSEMAHQKIWRPETMLQASVTITEKHMLVVRLLVKHLHALSGSPEPDQTSPLPSAHSQTLHSEDFKRVVTSHYVQRLYALLLHCFNHWPMETSFRAVLETWLSYIQPWRYQKHIDSENKSVPEKWASFVQENILMYTTIFHCFLKRVAHADLINSDNASMVFRITKVFAQSNLPELIQRAENKQLHQQQQRSLLSSTLMSLTSPMEIGSLSKAQPNMGNQELHTCQYTQMFGIEMRAEMLKLVQRLMQAQQTAKGMLNQQATAAVLQSLCSWFSIRPTLIKTNTEEGVNNKNKSDKKTVELLDKAIDYLSQIFKLNTGDLSHMRLNMRSVEYNEESRQIPDCIQSDNGLVLTDLGRMQMINGLRRFDIEYQGDPQLQPVRSYENAALVHFMFWIATLINNRLAGHMSNLCSRQDLLGRLGQHYLITSTTTGRFPKSAVPSQRLDHHQRPRLSLRFLASYRTLLAVFLLFMLGSLFSICPLFSTCLIIMASFLHGLFMIVYMAN